jgi:FtsZ-binding cell division protein ZapB
MQFKQMIKQGGYLLCFLLLPTIGHAGALEEAIDTQVDADLAAQKSQQKIDQLDDDTNQMLIEYRDLIQQSQSLKAYNDQLQTLVGSQQEELASITAQLNNIETTQRDIVPLMSKMVEVLEQFVALDVPFLQAERQNRLIALKTMMGRADVSLSEKYRRIMEAYQVEMEYGRTLEAYQAPLAESDSRTVDFLRIGRVSLYYLTLDKMEAGLWDNTAKTWQPLPDDQIQSLDNGLKVARKQLPPDLLTLPLQKVGGQP